MGEVAVREPKDGTGAGMLEFLEWAATRGELAPATARSIAVSTRKVLEVEADPATVDVLNLDAEDLFDRFETLNRTKYTSQSLGVYKSRFLNAVAMYRAWLDKRSDWKTAGGWGRRGSKGSAKSGRGSGPARKNPPSKVPPTRGETGHGEASISREVPQASAAMVPYDLPLRPGLRVRLVLPEVLTRADADRIAAFVASLAFDQAEDDQGSI